MSRAASAIPDEGALLCEGCGYILTGLPHGSRCPECSKPIEESAPALRGLPPWEREDGSRSSRFWRTTASVLFRPTHFYRTLATRNQSQASATFARRHYLAVSLLLGLAVCLQAHWLLVLPGHMPAWREMAYLSPQRLDEVLPKLLTFYAVGIVASILLLYGFLVGITHVAARLTAWEAAYRQLRLPLNAVVRGLHYHSPHYLPVAAVALVTVAGYQVLLALGYLTEMSATRYLYLLCAEVIGAAAYLFVTYWKGMRNMLFANG